MKEADKNIRQKINDLSNKDLPFDEANLWHRLEEKLDEKPQKIVFINWQRWATAACFLLISGIGFIVFNKMKERNLAANQVKNNSPKIAQKATAEALIKEKKIEKSTILKPELLSIKLRKEWKGIEHFAKNENPANEIFPEKSVEKQGLINDISPQLASMQIHEIQAKNVAMNTKTMLIKAPILALNIATETKERPRRRFAFSIHIFPSLTTPDTTHMPVYAYGQSLYQVKIKL